MGASANDGLSDSEARRANERAVALASALVRADCILVTGATTGLPDLVAQEFRRLGGFALGISPAENRTEHVQRYGLPEDGADLIVFTGFGYKGRNVINIRTSDIVLIFGGAIGTLNEFTIAYDEGKIIGVLEGSGGVVDHLGSIIEYCRKSTQGVVFFDQDPQQLVKQCLVAFERRSNESRQ
jgi:uncharacterized protein (TIGR00725 family)